MLTLQTWYLIGVVVCAGAFAVGIGEADGYDTLLERRVILPIIGGSLLLGMIWPLIIIAFVATHVLDRRRLRMKERQRK